jgi:cell division transport system permease protein
MSEVGIGLRRNLTMTFAVVITVAISLSLLGIGLLSNAPLELLLRRNDLRYKMI